MLILRAFVFLPFVSEPGGFLPMFVLFLCLGFGLLHFFCKERSMAQA